MVSYLTGHGTKVTPQSEPIPGSDQVPNSAGGFAFQIGDFDRLRRFLILGTEGGTYYTKQRQLTSENADTVRRCLAVDGPLTVDTIVKISSEGRAPKNDPALFALAVAASEGDDQTRRLALEALSAVARTGTHLFQFVGFIEEFRGWGRGVRRAVGEWYGRPDAAYQAIKYRQRGGWSHRDVLRLAHPRPVDERQSALFGWIVGLEEAKEAATANEIEIQAYEAAQLSASPKDTATLVRLYGSKLPREALSTDHLTDPDVWAAMLEVGMPLTAMIRNLATMTRVGTLTPMGDMTKVVVDVLRNDEALRRARVHPIAVLAALATYRSGFSTRGETSWTPVTEIVDALDGAFYRAFGNVEPTGKRVMLALDVSSSMTWDGIAGVPGLTPRVGSAAMALVTLATETRTIVTGFTSGTQGIASLNISPRQRLDDVVDYIGGLGFGGTDCSLPMLYATERGLEIDSFVVYTDNETWAGRIHPSQALREYRSKTGIPAKLIVVGMTATGFSIADPRDPGMLDVVGFDTATPGLISEITRS